MPKGKPRTPSLRHHKPSGLAVTTLNHQDFYLGKYGSEASQTEYDRLIAGWLANGRRLPSSSEGPPDYTISEVLAAYWRHAQACYVKDGRPTSEVSCIKQAVRTLQRLYGDIPAREFTPLKLKTVRTAMVDSGFCRNVVNRHVQRIKQVFRWAVENELIAPMVNHGLQAVAGLRKGRSGVRESDIVIPVDDAYVDAIQSHVSRQVWAIVELQRLSGMRSGEVVIMRGRDLDMSGKLWLYRPASHKTLHHGHDRTVELGPRALAVIRPFLKPDLEAFLFSPVEAEAERRKAMQAKRKTPISCGNRPGTNRKRKPKRTPKDRYTRDSYRRAIARACDLADREARKRKNLPPDSGRIIPRWHPHQLRHNFATVVRKRYGIETARILLGHRSAVVTEIYAEVDRTKARKIVARIG